MSRACNYFMTTARLGFGHWDDDDLPLAISLWGDPKVSVFLGGPFSAEEVGARLNREIDMMSSCKIQYWPAFLLGNGELAGCAGLRPYANDDELLELGFHLRPDYWGQGLAQEAARAVIAFAFQTLSVKGIFAGHHPENLASERVLLKLGFLHTHHEIYPPTGQLNPAYLLLNPAYF